MKKVIYVATLLVAAVCVAEEKAAKANGPDRPKGPRGHEMSPEMMKDLVAKFDKDGDGKLNETEAKAAREARQAEMMKKFDKDGDGKLSAEEMNAVREAGMIKRFDKDGDGKLNDQEKAAAEAFKKEADTRQAEMMKKFDKDGDGKLSDDERKAAREAFMKSHEGGKGDRPRGDKPKGDRPREEKK